MEGCTNTDEGTASSLKLSFTEKSIDVAKHTGRLWLSYDVARAWRQWRVKAKRKHAARLQSWALVAIKLVEGVIPCFVLGFAILPVVGQLFIPSAWGYLAYTLISLFWLRCALTPPSVFIFGVAASEHPFHVLFGNVAQLTIAVTMGHVSINNVESHILVLVSLALIANFIAAWWWFGIVRNQMRARVDMTAALTTSSMHEHYPSCMSLRQGLSCAFPFLSPASGVLTLTPAQAQP